MHRVLPEDENEQLVLDHFKLSDEDVAMLKQRSPVEYASIKAGDTYTRLRRQDNKGPVMTDTPMERSTNAPFLRHADGDILISGLGIGMIVVPALNRDGVDSVTVVEGDPCVIDLVEEPLRAYSDNADKLHVHQGDIFDFVPEHDLPDDVPEQYDCIYHDIWPKIDGDNYQEMKRLLKRFQYCLKEDGWTGCWRQEDVRERSHQAQCSSILQDAKQELEGQLDDVEV